MCVCVIEENVLFDFNFPSELCLIVKQMNSKKCCTKSEIFLDLLLCFMLVV